MKPHLVVGTAGHIDHGKSRLVWSLTGTDPDRLPEEKARGMTIDLGFAHLEIDGCDVFFVDVPGHERFIHNMVAGATGVDVALLVVAADDSVMPQTREHAEVLALLGIHRIILALTKIDLVEPAWADQVIEEAAALLESLGIKPLAVVRTSAQTGLGLDELRRVLAGLARQGDEASERAEWFNMPIDRVFTVAGRGTVVTGTIAHGHVARGDALSLFPSGREVHVRGLQTHYESLEQVDGRIRVALNLTGASTDEVRRGFVLATPATVVESACFIAHLRTLRAPGKRLRQRQPARLHIGTSDVLAEVRLIEKPAAPRVEGVYAQIITSAPLALEWGQFFLIRDEAASQTIGGGRVILPDARRWTSRNAPVLAHLDTLAGASEKDRVAEAIREAAWNVQSPARLAVRAGLPSAAMAEKLVAQLVHENKLVLFGSGAAALVVHSAHVEEAVAMLRVRMKGYLDANPRAAGLPAAHWEGWLPRAIPSRNKPAIADALLMRSGLRIEAGFIVSADRGPSLPADDATLLGEILQEYQRGGLQPPDIESLTVRTPRNEKKVRQLIEYAAARGLLHRFGDGLWLHADHWSATVRAVATALRGRGEMTVSDIRTLLNSTRKYVVPLCEALDAAGVTKRFGDVRRIGLKAPHE